MPFSSFEASHFLSIGGKQVKTMKECNEVRRLHYIDGLSIREISRQTGYHRETITKILQSGGPPEYIRRKDVRSPVLAPFMGVIDAMLEEDRSMPPKQNHTAQRIFDRLKSEHNYPGGYTQVRKYVAEIRSLRKEAFVPLELGPGVAQVDWGEAIAFDATREPPERSSLRQRKVYLFVMTLPFSNARFVAAFPRATQEFFLEGHRLAFEFFGGVPRRIIYDNLKSAVTKVGRGRVRWLNKTFEKFTERYLFEPSFCNIARGNEKGHVEGGVGWSRRNMFVPMPRFSDWDDFNAMLAEGCRKHWNDVGRGDEKSVGARLEEERKHLTPLPREVVKPLKAQHVNSLCLVRFDTNNYSTPCQYAHHPVITRPTVGKIRIYQDDRLIAQHQRCYGRYKTIYEPWHYLALIERKPRALDDGAPMKQLKLDESFSILRRRLEVGQMYSRGTREYIRILRLLEDHSLGDLTRSVRRAIDLGVEQYEAVKNLLLCPAERTPTLLDLSSKGYLAAYRILPAPIANYQVLVGVGGLS